MSGYAVVMRTPAEALINNNIQLELYGQFYNANFKEVNYRELLEFQDKCRKYFCACEALFRMLFDA